MFSTKFKKISLILIETEILKILRCQPRWQTCCDTISVAIETVLN